LIDIGIDVLNPVQPECMDPVEMKRLYGNRLSFRGTVGTQTTMPFGTPEEVEETCKRMIEKVGKDGGLVLAPTHMLEPEVPWENIEAMLNAIEKYSTV
jgi:uroporphyrinogen decarboxylase